jgi:tRNA (cytidine32/uridine32-2'-O)-methyltransferase
LSAICDNSGMSAAHLQRFRIVLVGTTHPGNIGSVARAMKTMGLSRLSLVAPVRFPAAEATAMACGADDLLVRAEIFPTLAEALVGVGTVVGTTARRRGLPWPVTTPREAMAELATLAAAGEEVALVFGRESAGLSNEEIGHCGRLLVIPTAPDFGSLNLAAAVQVLAYEARLAVGPLDNARPVPAVVARLRRPGEARATAGELEGFYQHLFATLAAVDFFDPAKPRRLVPRIRRLFHRASLLESEVQILRGFLTAVDRIARHRAPAPPAADDRAAEDRDP